MVEMAVADHAREYTEKVQTIMKGATHNEAIARSFHTMPYSAKRRRSAGGFFRPNLHLDFSESRNSIFR